MISLESVPSKIQNSSNKLHLQRSFHFILNFPQFVKHGKSNMIVVWYLIKLIFCVHFKLKISLHENLVYVSAFLVNATTITVMNIQYLQKLSVLMLFLFLFIIFFLYDQAPLNSSKKKTSNTQNPVYRFSFIMNSYWDPFVEWKFSDYYCCWLFCSACCKYWTLSNLIG